MKLNVPDMSCNHCKAAIESAIDDADPLADLTFDIEARQVDIDTDLAPAAVMDVLAKAGYPATPAQ